MYNIVKRVLEVVETNKLTEVEAIVLRVGEQSGVVAQYLHSCYPASVSGTLLERTALKVEFVESNAVCRSCNKVFPVKVSKGCCPRCEGTDCEIVSGKEFMLKEIHAR